MIVWKSKFLDSCDSNMWIFLVSPSNISLWGKHTYGYCATRHGPLIAHAPIWALFCEPVCRGTQRPAAITEHESLTTPHAIAFTVILKMTAAKLAFHCQRYTTWKTQTASQFSVELQNGSCTSISIQHHGGSAAKIAQRSSDWKMHNPFYKPTNRETTMGKGTIEIIAIFGSKTHPIFS